MTAAGPLSGRVAAVTGGDSGIGAACALAKAGPDARALEKRGVAAKGFGGERDVKEAEVAVRGGRWAMGFEYARKEESLIGYAEGDGPAGPWRELKHGFGPRGDRFDRWHLSPGPMLLGDPDHPIMFYNGATRDAAWGIGWAVFDHPNNRILDRCEEPPIAPPGEENGRNMAFAASLTEDGDRAHLYFPYNDRTCHRAVIARHEEDCA